MGVWGGAAPLLGTNPLAVGIPSGGAPVVLDIATSVVSYGTVKNHRLQGRKMPSDWIVNSKTGAPITDPEQSGEGLLLPIGGYKGAGLSLVLGLLAGTLNGARFGRNVIDFNVDQSSACDNGHFIIALDVTRFVPLDQFRREVDRHLNDMRASPILPGHDAVRLPGDQRQRRRDDRIRNGVPIVPELIAQLDQLAADLKIRPLRGRV
jgi:LDH2 family malate/lactate/ureidoglycolate dehydrogenase